MLAIGLDSDKTFRHFLLEADRLGAAVTAVSLREVVLHGSWAIGVPDGGDSYVETGARRIPLDPGAAVFCRPITLESVQDDPLLRRRWAGLVRGLRTWLALAPGKVVNRPGGHAHNGAKGLHVAWLGARGLAAPPSIVSADPDRLREFARGRRVIMKAATGVRAFASEPSHDALAELDPHGAPVHLQELIEGDDVRAHVVGERVFALAVSSDALDYRRPGTRNSYSACTLPPDVERRVVEATRAMGLCFAGWDFKVDRDGRFWCLEANPMPGYSSYDGRLGGAISAALVEQLSG